MTLRRLLTATSLLLGCAAELDGKPEDYKSAYGGPLPPSGAGGGGTGAMTTGGTSMGGQQAAGMTQTAGTTQTAGSGGSVTPPLDSCAKEIFATCVSCHSTALAAVPGFGNLDLSGDDVGTRLRDKVAAQACGTSAKLIDPAAPGESVLLKRTLAAGTCGALSVMPPTTPLTAEQRSCLTQWLGKFR